MTEVLYNPKIRPEHLARKAIVYLRQSSDKQVRQNKESQLLQYAVAERVRAEINMMLAAMDLHLGMEVQGWPPSDPVLVKKVDGLKP
jgi:hypothetical protein